MASPQSASPRSNVLLNALRRPIPLPLPPQMRTVRVRLAIWNVSILAAALLLFIVLLRYQVQRDVLQFVDRDLESHSQRFPNRRPNHKGHGPHFDDDEPPHQGFGKRSVLNDGGPPDGDGPSDGDGPPQRPDGRDHGGGPPLDLLNHGGGPLAEDARPRERIMDLTGKVTKHEDADTSSELWDATAFRQARDLGKEQFSTSIVDGETTRVYTLPLRKNGGITSVLQVKRPLTDTNQVLDIVARTLWLSTPLCLALAGAGGIFLTSRALRPVRRMAQAASTITAQEMSGRLPETGGDEFADLAATFNGMLTRLETAFEQQRRFTSDASHELRTPLAAIKAHTSLALRGDRDASELRQAVVAADAAVDRASRTVQDLLLLARSDTGRLGLRLELVDLPDVLLGAMETLEMAHHEPIAPIELGVSTPPPPIGGDAHHLTRLFTNLLENAIRHTPTTGKIRVRIEPQEDAVIVVVQDTGEGIAPEHLPHIGERFYRVDASRTRSSQTGGGTGLGFAICRSIVDAHSGTLTLHSVLGEGTEVRVTLPRITSVQD